MKGEFRKSKNALTATGLLMEGHVTTWTDRWRHGDVSTGNELFISVVGNRAGTELDR
jgi:hypothetical protein